MTFLQLSTEVLNIIIVFSDGIGNRTQSSIVQHLLGVWFACFAILLVTKRIVQNGPNFSTSFLLIGLTFSSIRDTVLFMLDHGITHNYISSTPTLLATIPIIDHTFQLLYVMSMSYAILYLCQVKENVLKWYCTIFIVPFILYYFVCNHWLTPTIHIENEPVFYYLGEKLYHWFGIGILVYTLYNIFKAKKIIGGSILAFVMFMLTSYGYALVDAYTKRAFTNVCIPLHNCFFLWSIPCIIYYIQTIPVHRQCLVYKCVNRENPDDKKYL